jgi:hypothetical protein
MAAPVPDKKQAETSPFALYSTGAPDASPVPLTMSSAMRLREYRYSQSATLSAAGSSGSLVIEPKSDTELFGMSGVVVHDDAGKLASDFVPTDLPSGGASNTTTATEASPDPATGAAADVKSVLPAVDVPLPPPIDEASLPPLPHPKVLGVWVFGVTEAGGDGVACRTLAAYTDDASKPAVDALGDVTVLRLCRSALPEGYERSVRSKKPSNFFHSFVLQLEKLAMSATQKDAASAAKKAAAVHAAPDAKSTATASAAASAAGPASSFAELPDQLFAFCYTIYEAYAFSAAAVAELKLPNADKPLHAGGRYYVPRTICVLSPYQCNMTFAEALGAYSGVLLKAHKERGAIPSSVDTPLVSVVGDAKRTGAIAREVFEHCSSLHLPAAYTDPSRPPALDVDLVALFSFVSADQCVSCMELMLADRSLLFMSQSARKVSECLQAFTALLFPFGFQHKYRSLAPADQPPPWRVRVGTCESKEHEQQLRQMELNTDESELVAGSAAHLAHPFVCSLAFSALH